MKIWSVQDAKSRFSQLLNTCLSEGPQVISRHEVEKAVLVSITEWKRLNKSARPSLKALLLAEDDRLDLTLPVRGLAKRRKGVTGAKQ
jgi:prevent-host-death family protein